MSAAIYMPILKGKRGELSTLREIGERQGLLPLVEVPRVKWNYDADEPAHSIEDHIAKFRRGFEKALQSFRVCALDTYLLDIDGSDDSTFALNEIAKHSATQGHPVIPATGLERSADYNRVAGQHARRHSTGCVIRLEREDLYDTAALKASVEDLMGQLRLSPRDIDLVADIKRAREEDEGSDLEFLMSALPLVPYLSHWRSFWFAGGSFPEFLTNVKRDSKEYLPRVEWTIWNALARGLRGRVPRFADYGIAHPISPDVDTRVMSMSANIRYTTEHHWLVVKGRSTRTHGNEQFNELCGDLVGMTEYCGASFSAGDRYFFDCAHGDDGPGNATKWRQAGNAHHIEYVSQQIEKARRLIT